MNLSPDLSLDAALKHVAADVETALDAFLPPSEGANAGLADAMRHAVLGGGKRLRPFLVMAAADLFAVPAERALRVAAALEMVHGYSLVHDDLPAMDDDDLRRGRPTVHVAFDEATAILAGDALLTKAFEILAGEETHPDPAVRCRLVAGLARAAGADGMVGGQMMDLKSERRGPAAGIDEITELQILKTGALICFAVESGAVMANAEETARDALRAYGRDLGLAFQIADDLLDAEGHAAAVGKRTGKDAAQGKATFVSLLGIDGARERARDLSAAAVNHLDVFPEKADLLRQVARFAITRGA